MRNFIIIICSLMFIFYSCEKNEPEIPDGYRFLVGDWHTYSFKVEHNIGSPYYYSETFDSTQIPFQLKVSLEEYRWEVMFDNTFICGREIEGFEFADANNPNGYLLDGSGGRAFNVSYNYSDSTLYFYRVINDNVSLGGDMAIYSLRRDN